MIFPPFKTHQDFENWLAEMEERSDQFISAMPAKTQNYMDYSPTSLEVVEEWILDHYPNTQAMLEDEEIEARDGVSRYVGEVFRQAIKDSVWRTNIDRPKAPYYGMPFLCGPEEFRYSDSPFSIVTASANRRTGCYIRTVFDNALKAKGSFYRGKIRYSSIISDAEREEWLSEMDEALQYFFAYLPAEVSEKLDYSPLSLRVIELWTYEHCPNTQEILMDKYPEVSDGASRYIGEVFRRNLEGEWDIILNDSGGHFSNLPIVRGYKYLPYKKCPVAMATMVRRTATYLIKAYENIAKHSLPI